QRRCGESRSPGGGRRRPLVVGERRLRRRGMQLLPDARSLKNEGAEEHDAEHGRDDLLPLLLRLESVAALLGHYGAPVAEALLEGVSLVVVVSVAVVVEVAAGGVAAGTTAGAGAYTTASITTVDWICRHF